MRFTTQIIIQGYDLKNMMELKKSELKFPVDDPDVPDRKYFDFSEYPTRYLHQKNTVVVGMNWNNKFALFIPHPEKYVPFEPLCELSRLFPKRRFYLSATHPNSELFFFTTYASILDGKIVEEERPVFEYMMGNDPAYVADAMSSHSGHLPRWIIDKFERFFSGAEISFVTVDQRRVGKVDAYLDKKKKATPEAIKFVAKWPCSASPSVTGVEYMVICDGDKIASHLEGTFGI